MDVKRFLVVLATVAALCAGFVTSSTAATVRAATSPPTAFDVTGVDLHDGTIVQIGGAYYLYGTEYGCGFAWGQVNTPWCGFGVSTSTDKVNWSPPALLFSPNEVDSWTGATWAQECGATGAGCFNPRMIQRSGWGANDGVWILWFNAPADYNRSRANAYYAMGCNSPTGPCGDGHPPHGSTHKPNLWICGGNGDFTMVPNGTNPPVMLCTQANQTLSSEQIDEWGTNGINVGSNNLAGLNNVEAPGAYQDQTSGKWVMTYSDPNCGYCAGTGTGYATTTNLIGQWTAPSNVGVNGPISGRRDLSATSCGGQPRAISIIDGYPYQGIDLWNGSMNETHANLHFEPLTYQGETPPGQLWQPFSPWACR